MLDQTPTANAVVAGNQIPELLGVEVQEGLLAKLALYRILDVHEAAQLGTLVLLLLEETASLFVLFFDLHFPFFLCRQGDKGLKSMN